jgi:hypothetical protein
MWFIVVLVVLLASNISPVIGLPIMIAPLLLVGLFTVYLGAKRLSRPAK